MADSSSNAKSLTLKAYAIIVAAVGFMTIAFAYTAGWFPSNRLTPKALVKALEPPGGPVLGHRRNHAKGICFTGIFEANGDGVALSKAQVFEHGQYPLVGRFNIAGADPHTPDPMAGVRGLGIRIITPNGQEWRSAMIDAPVFAAPTPQAFYAFLQAAASKDPGVISQYSAAHREILTFVDWVKNHPRTESWAEDRFNSLDSFAFVDSSGTKRVVRWSFVPFLPSVAIPPSELAKRDPDFLAEDITKRVAVSPPRWKLIVTIADPGDPSSDPTTPWPADRRAVDTGTLIVQQVLPEADGPCRDINFDPTVLPAGITTSDDPFPAARSAAYRESYDSRLAESSSYPRTQRGEQQ